jgi:hypothetical protein
MLNQWFAFILPVDTVMGWGPSGHRIVAEIAESLLTDTVRSTVTEILGVSMSSVATWADDIDHTPEFSWTRCMHYIDTDSCSIDTDRDCVEGCCVVNAIHNYTTRLAIASRSVNEEAAKFLIHFMGDVHQPLHAGHRSDKGGNTIQVYPNFHRREDLSQQINLHEVWDSIMMQEHLHERHDGDWKQYADAIISSIRKGRYKDDTACPACAFFAAQESASNACNLAYVNDKNQSIESGDLLDRQYYESRMPVIESRLAIAGIRLANLFNTALAREQATLLPETRVV